MKTDNIIHTTIFILLLQEKYKFSLAVANKFPSRHFYENEKFLLNKIGKKYNSQKNVLTRIHGASRGKGLESQEKLKKLQKSKRNVENIWSPEAVNTYSKTTFKNSLSSEVSLKTSPKAPGYLSFKLQEINQNNASPGKTFIRSYLPQETLKTLCKSLLVHPFKTWKLKHKFLSMKDIGIHEDELHAVIENPKNKRLKQKLNKVLQGKDIYLDVIGGSNTAGGGVVKEEGTIEGIYSKVIVDWWSKAITSITGSKLRLRQVAMGGTSSEFFQFCFVSYIHKVLDIVFIEMAVNDVRPLPANANASLPLEQLTRQLLEYPTGPTLIYVNVFNGKTCKEGCINLEDYGLGILVDLYNITSFSWRDAVNCPTKPDNNQCMLNACDVICSVDGFHINQLGHAHIALMVINLFRKILLGDAFRVLRSRKVRSKRGISTHRIPSLSTKITDLPLQDKYQFPRETSRQDINLPPPVLIKNPSNIITKPLCWTSLTPNVLESSVKNNLKLVVTKNEGFYMVKNKHLGAKCKKPCRVDAYSSWTGDKVGANTTISFTIPESICPEGNSTRSVAVGVRTCVPCGAADMWLDNDYKNRAYIQTKLTHGRTTVHIIAVRVEPGKHDLNIEIVKKGTVSFVGLMIGPQDGPY